MPKRRNEPDSHRRNFLKGAGLAGAAALSPIAAGAQVSAPKQDLKQTLKAPAPGSEDARDIVALIYGIEMDDAVKEIRVFVDHPAPNAQVPTSDPHFVARIAFLKHSRKGGHDHGKALPSAIVNLCRTTMRQNIANISTPFEPNTRSERASMTTGDICRSCFKGRS